MTFGGGSKHTLTSYIFSVSQDPPTLPGSTPLTVISLVPGSTETDNSGAVNNWVSTLSVTSRVAVVITDGNSNVDSGRTVPEAVALHQSGVHVITVSVGQIYNETELRAIASRNGTVGNYFHVDRYDQLEALASSVQASLTDGQSLIHARSRF